MQQIVCSQSVAKGSHGTNENAGTKENVTVDPTCSFEDEGMEVVALGRLGSTQDLMQEIDLSKTMSLNLVLFHREAKEASEEEEESILKCNDNQCAKAQDSSET